MDREMVFLLVGGSIGFSSSILTIFAIYWLDNMRLKRQWAREDDLSQQQHRQEMAMLALDARPESGLTETQGAAPATEKGSVVTMPEVVEAAVEATHKVLVGADKHPLLADLDLDTLRVMLAEEISKPYEMQKTVLVKRLQTAIEWFEKSEESPEAKAKMAKSLQDIADRAALNTPDTK